MSARGIRGPEGRNIARTGSLPAYRCTTIDGTLTRLRFNAARCSSAKPLSSVAALLSSFGLLLLANGLFGTLIGLRTQIESFSTAVGRV